MSDQLSLFGADEPALTSAQRGTDAALDERRAAASAIAARLPDGVRFGTSSWTFPGWKGLVYPSSLAATALGRDGLRHYARHPLLRTVGVDRSYYAPIPLDDLRAYADQLPDGFVACFKAPAVVTSRVEPTFGGTRGRGRVNADFLSPGRLIDDLLAPLDTAFRRHTGPIVLEFPATPLGMAVDPAAFADDLDAFLSALPPGFDYAVELRDRSLLTPAYAAMLARRGVAHTYNYWSAMPMPMAQAAIVPEDTAPFTVIRLLLKPGTWYEDQRERFRPFNRLVEPDDTMRGEVVELTARALRRGRKVYVLVNNKAEGSSPLTVEALAERLAEVWNADAPPSTAARRTSG